MFNYRKISLSLSLSQFYFISIRVMFKKVNFIQHTSMIITCKYHLYWTITLLTKSNNSNEKNFLIQLAEEKESLLNLIDTC